MYTCMFRILEAIEAVEATTGYTLNLCPYEPIDGQKYKCTCRFTEKIQYIPAYVMCRFHVYDFINY